MAATPTHQESANAAVSTRDATVTFTGQPLAGDVIVLFPSSTTTATITVPSGWVNVLGGTTDVESDSHQICAVYHVVTAAEEAASTKTYTAANLYDATETGNTVASWYRGVDLSTPLAGTGSTFNSGNSTTPHVLASVTPTVTGGVVLSAVAKDATGAYSSTPSGWTTRTTSNTNQGKALLSYDTLTTDTVAVGPTNITPSAGDEYASISLVLRPLSGVARVAPMEFDFDTSSVVISGGNFLSPQSTGKVYLSDAATLAGSANEVEITAAVTAWSDTSITLNLSGQSAGFYSALDALGPGQRYLIVTNSASNEYASGAVTVHRRKAFFLSASSFVDATPGEAVTSQRLTTPGGKTGAAFVNGRATDDVNPSPTAVAWGAADKFTEVVQVVKPSTSIGEAAGQTYVFRWVLEDGTALGTYTVTPTWAISAGANVALSLTETGDSTSAALTLAGSFTAAITEGGDGTSAALTLASDVALSITETGDTTAATLSTSSAVDVALASTETGDATAAALTLAGSLTLGLTEAGDATAATLTVLSGNSFTAAITEGGDGTSATLRAVTKSGTWPKTKHSTPYYLLDQLGDPWAVRGDALWSILAQLTDAEIVEVLTDRAARGFNLIMVNLFEQWYSDNYATDADILNNRPWQSPFTPFLSALNPTYMARAVYVIEQCWARGITVLLCPQYFGKGASEGWQTELAARSTGELTTAGEAIGAYFKDYENIVWLAGGDNNQSALSLTSRQAALITGIKNAGCTQMWAAHPSSLYNGSDDYPGAGGWTLDIDTVYLYSGEGGTYPIDVTQSLWGSTARPMFFLESHYENNDGVAADLIRRTMWQTLLSCYGGTIVGAAPLWDFESPHGYQDVGVTSTTIASGSNGQTLPQSTINLASAASFPTRGGAEIVTSAGPQTVSYTGKSGNQLTGCTGGTGTMSTGGAASTYSWRSMLGGVTSTAAQRAWGLMATWPFATTTVDTAAVATLLTAGRGSGSTEAAAVFSTTRALVYMPTNRSFTLDMTEFGQTMAARWYDPTSGDVTFYGTHSNTGTWSPTHPGTNAAGQEDWLLILDVAVEVSAAITEGADSTAATLTVSSGVDVALAVTEGADATAAALTLAGSFTAAITESGDATAAALTLAGSFTLSAAEAGDSTAASLTLAGSFTAALTEGADATSAALALAGAVALALTETGDSTSALLTTGQGLTIALTEGADATSAALTLASGAAAAIVEAGDATAATLTVAGSFTGSITEAGDTTAATVQLGVYVAQATTEAGDASSALLTVGGGLTVQLVEGADSASATLTLASGVTIALTEGGDQAAAALALAGSFSLAATEAGDVTQVFGRSGLDIVVTIMEHGDTTAAVVTVHSHHGRHWRGVVSTRTSGTVSTRAAAKLDNP